MPSKNAEPSEIDYSKQYENVLALKQARRESQGFHGVVVRDCGCNYVRIDSGSAIRCASRGH